MTIKTDPQNTLTAGNRTNNINYMVLINRCNPLPDDWIHTIEIVQCKNSLGDLIQIEKKTCSAYLKLKAALEADNIFIDLDSALRSAAEQKRIMEEFTERYGAEYAMSIIAPCGYSEHHTGLAIDLYLRIGNKNILTNEDLEKYPGIWSFIHNKSPEHGFILRYPKNKEFITGYGYEPWHLRYIDNADAAKYIMSNRLTLEEYMMKYPVRDILL